MNIFRNAIDAQEACNLSGVVHQFSRDMRIICEEVRSKGGGTDAIPSAASTPNRSLGSLEPDRVPTTVLICEPMMRASNEPPNRKLNRKPNLTLAPGHNRFLKA